MSHLAFAVLCRSIKKNSENPTCVYRGLIERDCNICIVVGVRRTQQSGQINYTFLPFVQKNIRGSKSSKFNLCVPQADYSKERLESTYN